MKNNPDHNHNNQANHRNRQLGILTLALLLAGMAGLGYWWLYARNWVTTDDAFVTGNVITLSSQTTGTVVEVLAENTQLVEAGDVLVRLDGARAEIALEEAKAGLGETVRRIAALFSDVEKHRQQIQSKQASLTRLQHDLKRYRGAIAEEAISQQQLQNAEDQARELEAAIRQARAELKSAEAQVAGTTVERHPAVLKSAALLKRSYLEFVRQRIVAPVRGYVAKRRVQVGDELHPGSPLLAIVPLDYLWIEANLRETEMERVRPGQEAEITANMLGKTHTYRGVVEGIHPGTGSTFALLPPENASGNFIHIVERVPVRIKLSPDEIRDYPLRPGLSTLTRINVAQNGQQVLHSFATTSHPAYRTSVYERELIDADDQIRQIIGANLPQTNPPALAESQTESAGSPRRGDREKTAR
jgi:membrane fusion protein (multidrug efflux system)